MFCWLLPLFKLLASRRCFSSLFEVVGLVLYGFIICRVIYLVFVNFHVIRMKRFVLIDFRCLVWADNVNFLQRDWSDLISVNCFYSYVSKNPLFRSIPAYWTGFRAWIFTNLLALLWIRQTKVKFVCSSIFFGSE